MGALTMESAPIGRNTVRDHHQRDNAKGKKAFDT